MFDRWPDMSHVRVKLSQDEIRKIQTWVEQIQKATFKGDGVDPLVPFEGDTSTLRVKPMFCGFIHLGQDLASNTLLAVMRFKVVQIAGVDTGGSIVIIDVPKHLQEFGMIRSITLKQGE
jgi:hypothetical protein